MSVERDRNPIAKMVRRNMIQVGRLHKVVSRVLEKPHWKIFGEISTNITHVIITKRSYYDYMSIERDQKMQIENDVGTYM